MAKELKEDKTNPTLTLSGKIKGQVKPGKPDRSGKPTAWSKFAAHWPDRAEARMVLATYHGWTANVALSLPADSAITAQGYLHEKAEPERLDTFSVIALHQYPGKAAETNGRASSTSKPRAWQQQYRRPQH